MTLFLILCQISVIACALVSGVFLTFSDFVMRSLKGTETTAGISIMQVINREVYKTVFMVLLLGMSALSVLLTVYVAVGNSGSASGWVLTGGLIYLVGVLLVTMVANVPMNKNLDLRQGAAAETAAYWRDAYLPRWTFWNSVRTTASALSAVCYLIACVWLAQGVPIG